MNDLSPHDSEAYVFLCCLDIIERLDTLILEIRHIQKNIIYVLRTPELYTPLREEEDFIWHVVSGDLISPWDILADPKKVYHSDLELVAAKLPSYPKPLSEPSEHPITQPIRLLVNELFTHGVWNTDQRSHYRNLVVLQKIKTSIFKDKLRICREAVEYFQAYELLDKENDDSQRRINHARGRLLLLRSVMLARARNYVKRVGDLQAVFGRSQDFGLQDTPRPNVNRRRDQHLYGIHLFNRCRDVRMEMGLLMDASGIQQKNPDNWVFHLWQHHYSSTWDKFQDEASENATDNLFRFYNINTSYWMPERPDLQPCIIHEIAHTIIDESLDDLFPPSLDISDSELVRFFKHIRQGVEYFYNGDESIIAHSFWKELAADILAASVNGPSYLYALLLEILGSGTESLFEHPVDADIYDPELLVLIDKGFSDQVLDCEWYCRLRLTAKWVKCTYPEMPDRPLVERLCDATEILANQLLGYLEDKNVLKPRNSIVFWKNLADRLCQIAQESEKATDTIKQWLTDRAEDHYKADVDTGIVTRGEHNFPRATRRLNWEARNFLVRELATEIQKRLGNKELDQNKCNEQYRIYGINAFYEFFLNTQNTKYNFINNKLECQPIFPRLFDIPWQYALFRGLDFVHPKSLLKPVKNKIIDQSLWFTLIHTDAHMGRNLYWLGLEIYLRQYAPPSHRLSECCGWVKAFIKNNQSKIGNSDKFNKCIKNMNDWLGENSISPINDTDKVNSKPKEINITDSKYYNSWLDFAKKYKPNKLLEWEYRLNGENTEKFKLKEKEILHRRMLRVQGFKIQALLDILIDTEANESDYQGVKEIKNYLELRSMKKQQESFFKDTEQLLTFNSESKPLALIRRYYIAGAYDIGFLMPPGKDNEKKWKEDMYMRCGKSIEYTKPCWLSKFSINDSLYNKEIVERYSLTLGRNDAISLSNDTPLSRCRLPDLPNGVRESYKNLGNDIVGYVPYFERKEMAIRVNPMPSCDRTRSLEDKKEILAFLSLSLRHGTARIDFLVRLIAALNLDSLNPKRNKDQYIHQIANLSIKPENLEVYLCDGWADILIVFHEPPNLDSNSKYDYVVDIFRFQNIVFQDFQVDRTEIVPTPQCADIAMDKYRGPSQNGDSSKLTLVLSFNARLLEDRYSELKNEAFVKQVQKGLEELSKKHIKHRLIKVLNEESVIFDESSEFKELTEENTEPTDGYFDLAKKWLNALDKPTPQRLEAFKEDFATLQATAEQFAKKTIQVSRTPGRLDFSLRIQSGADLSGITYNDLLQYLKLAQSTGLGNNDDDAGHVDRLQTTLAYRYKDFE